MFMLCVKRDDGAVGVFSYLTGQLITDACKHAITHSDFEMALLISQAFGSEDNRHIMLKQLAVWSDTQVSLRPLGWFIVMPLDAL